MRVPVVLSILSAFAVSTPSSAQSPAPDLAACAAMAVDKDRLACIDAAAKKPSGSEEMKTAGTKEILASNTPTDFKVVDPIDLKVAPRKYQGKPIELRGLQCFHADANEFRCIAPGEVYLMLMAADVSPTTAKSQIEDQCGELRKAITSSACRKTVRFIPLVHDDDLVNGYTKRTIVGTKSIEVVAAPAPERRRR